MTGARRRYEIHERNRHGKHVWYFRRPGQIRVRLPGEYNSREYINAYNDAFAGKLAVQPVGRPAAHTLAWLLHQYRQSAHFKGLRPSTRRVRDSIFARLVGKSGTQPFKAIKRQHLQAAMDARADQPFAANNALKAIRKMFEWAVSAGHIDLNPCDGVKPIKAKTDGFHSWTVDQVEQYRKHHPVGTRARLALDIMLFCGLRRGDVVRVGPQHVREGLITLRTSKTNTMVYLTIWPELKRSIDATTTGDLAFMVTSYGKPFSTPETFGTWFALQCDNAGLPKECRAHGLRKAGATIAADNGATAHELCAMFGWTKLATAEIYTKEADRKRLSRAASARIANNHALQCQPQLM
ncbi:tyrosine-type recombinase/integrase [Mesorhizobium sp. B4-1-4]|uniref:tyrosine-type recombinase/integrase n=1 Tax=Mesorhizobium sp. B4-1-4 TaxID=2589888 RepID=UPI0011261026|nr:tyrosine-type recombinase/integrase [Mesorhizobium sp. B4-1-4]UCI30504.1 tyrosine-type recombinase/integrase [Mesorhizobium sp. B4-1-4]